jgi:Nif-specific regulatory protein
MALAGLKSGSIVGDRYCIEHPLGQGELGCAYTGRDLVNGEARVVIRALTEWNGSAEVGALCKDLSILGRFRHPQLAHLVDFGVIEGGTIPYLVRAFVNGNDILQGSEEWDIDGVLHHMVQLCRVLHYLHERGIAHRRLKPSNLILAENDRGELQLKLLDFGLGQWTKTGRRTARSLAYIAPEVLLGHIQNSRSDLYSLGILMYQLLTRRLPFDDDDQGYLVQKHLQGKVDVRPIERLKGGAGLAQVLLALLEKDPEKRPSSAEDVVRLLSVASGRDFSGTVSRPAEAYFAAGRFVGRDKEMAFFRERATRVRERGRGATVFLEGESGSGKSRCFEELKIWALLEGWKVVEAACLPREVRSYEPYRQILGRAPLLRAEPTGAASDSALFRFDDVPKVADPTQIELSSGSAAGPFRDLLTREIVRLLADRPTFLLLHDFHWADEATVSVLDYLTSDILAHPILMCVSLRPGESERGPLRRLMELSVRQQRAETCTLGPLPQPAVEELVACMTGESSLAREIGPWTYEWSGGNPFFVEEILKHLVDQKIFHRDLGKWRFAAEGFERLEVPSTIAAVLKERLARLSPGVNAVTEWLALMRRAVTRAELEALSSFGPEELRQNLQELMSRQIIREVNVESCGGFAFRHALFPEVIAESLPAAVRRRKHRQIGEILEQQRKGAENLQELATHFTEARCGAKAVDYALRAARACKAEFANEPALRFYEYVLQHRRLQSVEQVCEASIEAADVCCAIGNPKRAIDILNEASQSSANRKRTLSVKVCTQLARAYQFLGQMEDSRSVAEKGMKLLRRGVAGMDQQAAEVALVSQLAFCLLASSEPRKGLTLLKRCSDFPANAENGILVAHLLILVSGLCAVACDFSQGVKAARKAVELLEPFGALHLLPMAYSHLGICLAGMGKMGKALVSHERAVSAARRTRSPFLLSQALCNLTECLCRSGRFSEASLNSAKVLKAAYDTENGQLISIAALCQLEMQIATAQWADAWATRQRLLHENFDVLPVYAKALAYFLFASLFSAFGSFDDALRDLDKLDSLVSSETPVYYAALGKALRGKIYSQQGRLSEAKTLLERMEVILGRNRWAYAMALTKLNLGHVLLSVGDLVGASKRARDLLRLARMMPAPHLQIDAHCLCGRIALTITQTHLCGIAILKSDEAANTDALLQAAKSEIEKAIELSKTFFTQEIAWRVHHLALQYSQMMHDVEASRHHAREGFRLICLNEDGIPEGMLGSFRSTDGREQAKSDFMHACQNDGIVREAVIAAVDQMEEEHLRILFRVANAVNAIGDLDQLMIAVEELLAHALNVERVLIALKEGDTRKLRVARTRNLEVASLEAVEPLSQYVLQEVIRSGSPFVTANARNDPRLTGDDWADSRAGTLFCAPLISCGRTLGVLYADHHLSTSGINESTISLFAAFCSLSAVAVDNALARRNLIREKQELEQYVREARGDYPELVGKSASMRGLRERIALAANSPLDVLILGESGTGKELVARALHRTGRRSSGKFLALDCGSLSDSLVESELFGYRRGAFTGASENRAGLFEAAQGGVIFLDEISNLSLRMQGKLLRVLQEREVRRIGETTVRKIDVLVIAATNKDLREELRSGRFRNDLYFRLKGIEIIVPPLRERLGDIPLLLDWFLDKAGRNEGGRSKSFSQEAHATLMHYSYPGNVRELKNIVDGSYYSTPGVVIHVTHLPAEVLHGEGGAGSWDPGSAAWQVYKRIRDGLGGFDNLVKTPFLNREIGCGHVRQIIHLALAETGGRYRDSFRLLGIPSREYAIMMQFLKRNGCYLDFRRYRKTSR